MKDYFTYTVTINRNSQIMESDEYFSKFDDADYIQINSGKFLKPQLCRDRAISLLKTLISKENTGKTVAIVAQINPRLVGDPPKSEWGSNTVMRLLCADVEQLKQDKKLVYTLSGHIESAKPLTKEEFEIYFSDK